MLLAAGDPGEEVGKAKEALKYAAIGYGIAALAPVLVKVHTGACGARAGRPHPPDRGGDRLLAAVAGVRAHREGGRLRMELLAAEPAADAAEFDGATSGHRTGSS